VFDAGKQCAHRSAVADAEGTDPIGVHVAAREQ
jgi:hypothetical protein